MAGKLSLRDAMGDELDWETVEKMNALMDMQADYEAAYKEHMMEPKE